MNLEEYIGAFSDKEPQLLAELSRFTHVHVLSPRMLSGHIQGRLLSMLSKMISPKSILEIGTYTGYATLCLSEGLQSDGVIHTIEINDEIVYIAKSFFERSEYSNNIKLHVGSALDIIPTIDQVYDLVFIDADKSQYSDYYSMVFDKLRHGGYIIADNTLWNGGVVDKLTDKSGKGILAFNELVKNDIRVEKLILPYRDGLTLIRKK